MSILTKLTKRNLILNKKRAIGTIIGITLSVSLICAVSGMFTSFRETLIQNAVYERGYYHIAFETIDTKELSKYLVNKDIKKISVLYELGQSEYKSSNKEDHYLTVYSTNESDFNQLSYILVEGTFPSSSNEIVISQKMAIQTKLNVGDTLSLNIGTRTTYDGFELNANNPYQENNEYLKDTQHKEFKIVGITYRERNKNSVYAVTTDLSNDRIHAYLTLKNPMDYKQSFMELLNVDDYEKVSFYDISDLSFDYVINNELLRWEVFAFTDSTVGMFTSLAIIVIIVILIVSVFCIRNSFAISTTEKMKMFGMLTSVGATKKQIKTSVILEGMILGIIAVPIGILCGILAVFILVHVVNSILGDYLFSNIDGIVFKISLLPILLSIILGFITIYLSSISSAKKASKVSAIDNLRNSNEIKISPKEMKAPQIIKPLFQTGGILAYKNLKRSKSKYKTTVISLTISIFVFITMSAFIDKAFFMSTRYYTDYDYNVFVTGISKLDNDQITQLRELENNDMNYVLYSNKGISSVMDEDKVVDYDGLDTSNEVPSISLSALDDSSFRKYVKELGLNYDEVKTKGILINDITYWDEENEKQVIVERYSYKVGESVNIEYTENDSTKNISIEIATITTERPYGLENNYYHGGYLILNKDYQRNISFYPSRIMFDSENPEELVKKIELSALGVTVNNIDANVKGEKAMLLVISIFLYGFIAVISLIGVTNIFNTITSNMELRQKEFAMLKSVGMTKKEFNRMINLETIFYCSKSLFYGIILGLLGSFIIHMAFNKDIQMNYELPLNPMLISILFVFVIVFIIMKYSINKINKQNTIETIRNENI